jgi:hypothetical protein
VILGPSGAGKSSFLRAGLLPRLRGDDRRFLPLPTCGRSGHRRYNPAEQRPIRLTGLPEFVGIFGLDRERFRW